jgi:hypothetical protein
MLLNTKRNLDRVRRPHVPAAFRRFPVVTIGIDRRAVLFRFPFASSRE